MRVLIDTNVVLDFLQEREPFVENAARLFERIDLGEIEGFISAEIPVMLPEELDAINSSELKETGDNNTFCLLSSVFCLLSSSEVKKSKLNKYFINIRSHPQFYT
jgi:predicted nucleic acid-binding protein